MFRSHHNLNLQVKVISARKRSLGQGNIFTPVCHTVHRGCASVHDGIPPPPPGTRHPPQPVPLGPGLPWIRQPPRTRHPPRSGPPGAEHAGRYGQRAGSTHPTGMQSCFLNNVLRRKGSWSLWPPYPISRCAPAALYLRQKISKTRTPMNELSEQDVTVDVCSRKQQTHCSGRVCKTIKFLKI